MLGSSIAYTVILVFSVYGIAKQMAGRFAGVLGAFVITMYPLVVGLSRHYLLDVGLTAMAALAVWMLIETKRFFHWGASFLFGLAFGLGMLMKWSLAIFIAGPLALVAISIFFKTGDGIPAGARIKNLVLALAVMLAIAGPWYARNLNTLADFFQGFIASGLAEGDPRVASMDSWLFYFRHLLQFQLLAPFAFLFVDWLLLALFQKNTGLLLPRSSSGSSFHTFIFRSA